MAASKCLAEGGPEKVSSVACSQTRFYSNFSELGMGTALEGCQLNETRIGERGGVSDERNGNRRLQFSVGFELRRGGGDEKGSVLIMGVWDCVS